MMIRTSHVVVLGAMLEVGVCQPQWLQCLHTAVCDPTICEMTAKNVCQLKQADAVLHPLGNNCDSYTFIEGPQECADEINIHTNNVTEDACQSSCTADDACKSFSHGVVTDNNGDPVPYCKICNSTTLSPMASFLRTGKVNCLNCHEAVSSAQCVALTCVMTDGKCERDCQPPAPAEDGTCSYFCPQEGRKCKADGPSKSAASTATACKDLCSSDPTCNVFEFDTDSKMCQFCATDELVDAGVGFEHYWVAGERKCETTTTTSVTTSVTTQLPVTTLAPSESMTADVGASSEIAKILLKKTIKSEMTGTTEVLVTPTLAPSESMTADAGASSEIVTALIKKKNILSETTKAAGEGRYHSVFFFSGGALAGVSASLVFLIARRHCETASSGLLYFEE